MKNSFILVTLLFFTQFVQLLLKQSIPGYTYLDDYEPDEYDLESLKLYPLIKLQKLNDVQLTRILQSTSDTGTNNQSTTTDGTQTTDNQTTTEEKSTTDIQKEEYGFKIPMHIMSEDGIKNGGFVLYLLGIIYLYLFVYMIFKKFLFKIIEDLVFLIEDNQEFSRPIVYCLLNAMMYLFIALVAILDPQSNYGVANIVGTDAFNIFLLFGIIQYKYYEEQGQIDIWLYLRDSIYYLIGLIALSFFYLLNMVNWWVSLVFLGYYLIFIIIQSKNAGLKESIQKLLGLKHDDDSFNCEEQLTFKKRRESITELIEKKFVTDDELLKKKLMYMDNCLKQNSELKSYFILFYQKQKDNYDKYKIHAIFQKAVYRIIYSLRNKATFEKQQRAQFYADLFKKEKENKKSKFAQKKPDEESNIKNESQQLLENGQQDANSDMNFDEQSNINDQLSRHSSLNRNAQMHYDDNDANKNEQDETSGKDQLQGHQSDDDDEEGDRINISCPSEGGFAAKIAYIILLPLNLILYWLPDLSKKATIKRFVFSLLLNFILLGFCIFFIIEWTHVVCFAFSMEASTAGLSAGTLAVSIPYCLYNIKIAKDDKEVDFMQSFLQLGIYKIGICMGIAWLFSSIVFGEAELSVGRSPKSFGIVLIVFTGMLFITIVTFCCFFNNLNRL